MNGILGKWEKGISNDIYKKNIYEANIIKFICY